MKRIIFFLVTLALLLSLAGCRTETNVPSGTYYAQSVEFTTDDGQTITRTPYLGINEEDRSFFLGMDVLMSYAEIGTYQVKNNQLIAETQSTTLVFEIKDSRMLVLVDDGGCRFNIPPINTAFICFFYYPVLLIVFPLIDDII